MNNIQITQNNSTVPLIILTPKGKSVLDGLSFFWLLKQHIFNSHPSPKTVSEATLGIYALTV